ncbi:15278_t:CDS:2, partial [Racocetra persica]
TITVSELELALKEFILIYQHRTILSDAMMIKKAKLLADELGVPEGKEAGSVNEDVITESLPLLQRRKKNKERISVALCANADGSHKSNTKAWMFVILFQEWLQDFDHQMLQKHRGQHVLLLLDNCSSHKLDGLTL